MLWSLRLRLDQAFWGNLEKQKRILHKTATVTKLLEMEVWCKVISINQSNSVASAFSMLADLVRAMSGGSSGASQA